MRIDLSCPVELWHCKMPTGDNPVLAMQIYNLSDSEVNSVQVCVLCIDAEGEQFARCVERLQGLEIPARHAYEITMEAEEAVAARDLEVIIQKVWFVDGSVWRRGASPTLEYAPSVALHGAQLQVMQELAGPDAVCYPSDQGAVWVCVCGRANAARDDECRRCRRDKHELFTKLNEAAIERILFNRQSQVEEQQRRQREEARRAAQEKEASQRRRRRIRRAVIGTFAALLLLLGAAYGIYFHGIPYYRYYQANRALESNQYDAAKEQFLAISDYRDSASMASECDYRAAQAALSGGTYTSLRAAWQGFDALADYKDSISRAQEARYIYAEKLLAAGNWEEAIALYEQVPSFSDARMKRNQAAYEWANALMEKGDYAAAREKYLELGDYQNAALSAQECLYQAALLSLESDPTAAIEQFALLGDYRDSAVRLQNACYAAGNLYYEQKDYDTAAEYFLQAGDYSDAYRRAAACLYTPAVELMESGDYQKAAAMLEKIPNYQDSSLRLSQCYYQLGLALMEEEAYDGAREYFELAAGDLPEAEEARKEAIYLPALALLDNGMAQDALQLLASIPGYKDADEYTSRLLYARSQDSMEAEDYAAVIDALEQLGQYESNSEELAAARLSYAQALTDKGQYEEAISLLSSLSGEDAGEAQDRARYLLAMDLVSQEKYEEALPIFEALTDYADAETQYQGCVYQIALRTAEQGDLAGAALKLADIPAYRDAGQKMRAYAYEAGVSAREAGDLAAAAGLFSRAGAYQDAAALAQETADTYYAGAYEAAKAAMDKKNYRAAVETLSALNMDYLPEAYKDLTDMYLEARYQYAEALYNAKRPFEALVYYNQIKDYKDVAARKLTRSVYRIIGEWESAGRGTKMTFREDGTCQIDGKAYYYTVGASGAYALSIGEKAGSLTYTYNILSLSDDELNLRNIKTRTVYKMEKVR